MPKQPRGKRIGSDDHEFAVVSTVVTGDRADIEALAAHANGVAVEVV